MTYEEIWQKIKRMGSVKEIGAQASQFFYSYLLSASCTILSICGISGICVEMENSAGMYFHADLADFLFRCYFVVHECT